MYSSHLINFENQFFSIHLLTITSSSHTHKILPPFTSNDNNSTLAPIRHRNPIRKPRAKLMLAWKLMATLTQTRFDVVVVVDDGKKNQEAISRSRAAMYIAYISSCSRAEGKQERERERAPPLYCQSLSLSFSFLFEKVCVWGRKSIAGLSSD